MRIKIIGTISRNGVFEKNGKCPWDMPEETELLCNKLDGAVCIMTQRVLDRLPNKLLAKIKPIVIGYDCLAQTPEDAIRAAERMDIKEVWVLGGPYVFAYFLPIADEMHLTRVNEDVYGGDSFFPYHHDWQFVGLAGANNGKSWKTKDGNNVVHCVTVRRGCK